jgi:hypothetical protein
MEAAGDGVVALGEFEAAAYPLVPVLRQDCEHVGVEVRPAVADAGQRHGETNLGVSVKRADYLAADALGHDKDTPGNDVAVAVSPDFELKDDATLELFECLEGFDSDGCMGACVHGLID